MIRSLLNRIHAGVSLDPARRPTPPWQAAVGLAGVIAGMYLIRRFLDDQLDHLLQAGSQYEQLHQQAKDLQQKMAAGDDQLRDAAAQAYPSGEDLDPLHTGGRRFMADGPAEGQP